MFCKKVFGISLMYLMILGRNVGISEWIELPQFSDERKVYRGSFGNKYDRDKIIHEGQLNAQRYAFPNYTNNYFKHMTTVETNFEEDILLTSTPKFHEEKKIVVKEFNDFSDDDDDDDDAAAVVTDEDEGNKSETENTKINEEKIAVDTGNSSSILNKISDEKSEEIPPVKGGKQQSSFWEYLPIEFFKKIHKNLLKYQGRSADGKLQVLKSFESSLLNEIESRLAPVVNPVRKKRGSGWEESGGGGHDDDQVGFPSIEGALMAISFLTFAVYLVQLVMTLFRYLANNNNNQQPMLPQQQTFVVNRNKRSPSEESLRVLEYLDRLSNHKIN